MLVRRCCRQSLASVDKPYKTGKTGKTPFGKRAPDTNARKVDGTVRIAIRSLEYAPVPEEAVPGDHVARGVPNTFHRTVGEVARDAGHRVRRGGMHPDQRPARSRAGNSGSLQGGVADQPHD